MLVLEPFVVSMLWDSVVITSKPGGTYSAMA